MISVTSETFCFNPLNVSASGLALNGEKGEGKRRGGKVEEEEKRKKKEREDKKKKKT